MGYPGVLQLAAMALDSVALMALALGITALLRRRSASARCMARMLPMRKISKVPSNPASLPTSSFLGAIRSGKTRPR